MMKHKPLVYTKRRCEAVIQRVGAEWVCANNCGRIVETNASRAVLPCPVCGLGLLGEPTADMLPPAK